MQLQQCTWHVDSRCQDEDHRCAARHARHTVLATPISCTDVPPYIGAAYTGVCKRANISERGVAWRLAETTRCLWAWQDRHKEGGGWCTGTTGSARCTYSSTYAPATERVPAYQRIRSEGSPRDTCHRHIFSALTGPLLLLLRM